MTQGQVDVSRDATRLELTVTPRQSDADLDVYLFGRNGLVAQSTNVGPGSERIVVRKPEPGTHAVVVSGVDVPTGTTEFDYHEAAYSRGIGTHHVPAGRREDAASPGRSSRSTRRSRRTPSRSTTGRSWVACSSPTRRVR